MMVENKAKIIGAGILSAALVVIGGVYWYLFIREKDDQPPPRNVSNNVGDISINSFLQDTLPSRRSTETDTVIHKITPSGSIITPVLQHTERTRSLKSLSSQSSKNGLVNYSIPYDNLSDSVHGSKTSICTRDSQTETTTDDLSTSDDLSTENFKELSKSLKCMFCCKEKVYNNLNAIEKDGGKGALRITVVCPYCKKQWNHQNNNQSSRDITQHFRNSKNKKTSLYSKRRTVSKPSSVHFESVQSGQESAWAMKTEDAIQNLRIYQACMDCYEKNMRKNKKR